PLQCVGKRQSIHLGVAYEKTKMPRLLPVYNRQSSSQQKSALVKQPEGKHRRANRMFTQILDLQELQTSQRRSFGRKRPPDALVLRNCEHCVTAVGFIGMLPTPLDPVPQCGIAIVEERTVHKRDDEGMAKSIKCLARRTGWRGCEVFELKPQIFAGGQI